MRNRVFNYLLLAIFIVLLKYNYILANAGTPLLWAWMFHLYIANISISFFESLIIWRKFNKRNYFLILILLILANFTSMLAGLLLTTQIFQTDTIKESILAIYQLIITFILTLIIEYPFYLIILKNKYKYLKSFIISTFTNTLSYLIIVIIYIFFFNVW